MKAYLNELLRDFDNPVSKSLAYTNYMNALDEYITSYSKTPYGKITGNRLYVEIGAAFARKYATQNYLECMEKYK